MKYPLVSIVIATKNEEKNIRTCILSIADQTYPKDKIEIIIVDNNSNDRTTMIVKKIIAHHAEEFHKCALCNHGPERSAQRNYGSRLAKGEYILFLDADMSVSKNVIEECVEKFQTRSDSAPLIGIYIPERIIGDSFWCRVRDFERSFYTATVIDAVRFFPKKVWQTAGGFDENLVGPEDWDFDRRVRAMGAVCWIRSPLYHDERDLTISSYMNGKTYYMDSLLKYREKWGRQDKEVKKQLGLSYRYIGVFVENGKWKKLLAHPILTGGMFWLRGLVGIAYLRKSLFK